LARSRSSSTVWYPSRPEKPPGIDHTGWPELKRLPPRDEAKESPRSRRVFKEANIVGTLTIRFTMVSIMMKPFCPLVFASQIISNITENVRNPEKSLRDSAESVRSDAYMPKRKSGKLYVGDT